MTTPPYPGDIPPSRPPDPPTLSIVAFVCAALALLLCPILFGPAGIVFGYLANNKGEKYGKWAALASAVGLILGLALSLAVYNRT
ncbi:hypothetical protein [Nocardia bovistercoris]|uniref:DUF4190 domain-containing protein n=1 Tax=Nocardia bovistercoris TaxID=2785916 RepID=A0A931N1V0_9NOCA|nr:hypothetical protein [Nocardia bovistercoris]MBH0776077.1 hypothetical protein [Nocardia bovistercoris]